MRSAQLTNSIRPHEEEKPVEVYHQNPLAQMGQTQHRRNKTAQCEARVPARYTENNLPRPFPAPSKQTRLLNPCAATLNQNDQHDNKKDPGYNPDNRGLIHIDSLPS
jgi:hypothetical protein